MSCKTVGGKKENFSLVYSKILFTSFSSSTTYYALKYFLPTFSFQFYLFRIYREVSSSYVLMDNLWLSGRDEKISLKLVLDFILISSTLKARL